MKKGTVLGLVVAAAAVGVAAGMLFAPQKGKDLRKRISDEGNKFSDKVKDTFRKVEKKLQVHDDELVEV